MFYLVASVRLWGWGTIDRRECVINPDVLWEKIRGDSQLDLPNQNMKSSRASGTLKVWVSTPSFGAGA